MRPPLAHKLTTTDLGAPSQYCLPPVFPVQCRHDGPWDFLHDKHIQQGTKTAVAATDLGSVHQWCPYCTSPVLQHVWNPVGQQQFLVSTERGGCIFFPLDLAVAACFLCEEAERIYICPPKMKLRNRIGRCPLQDGKYKPTNTVLRFMWKGQINTEIQDVLSGKSHQCPL